ncbi:MAG: hypothetical protein HUJ29_02675 [Gammaproteobacteria bacterium]|nr:hypothetical protein [Gammaproteobacteria bacterium]
MTFYSTDYMASFRCIGSECEDTCCKQWAVRIDDQHYAALQRLADKHPVLANIVVESVVRVEDEENDAYASIEMKDNGFCPFLDAQQLCRIQTLGGFDALGNTCTFFPRVIYEIDGDIEVAGAFSCPEVVRGCLSSSNRPGLIEVDRQILPRDVGDAISNRISTRDGTCYEKHFPTVRDYFLQIAFDPMLTSKQKMYTLCYSSHRLSAQYNNDCGEEASQFVEQELERLGSKEIKSLLGERLEHYVDEEKLGLITVQSIFLIRSQHYQDEPLTPYINDIINSYVRELHDENPFTTEIEGLHQVYHRRKHAILDIARSQIEDYLSRHLQNCLLREWYIRFPDPFSYMLMLTLRQALLRFLLYSHPSIYKWCLEEQEHEATTLHKVIEELSIEMLFLFSRSIEHDTQFLQNIYSALITEQMMELKTCLCLLKGV